MPIHPVYLFWLLDIVDQYSGMPWSFGLCPLMQRDDPWTVRLLPKVHFGVHPVGLDGIEPDAPGITVLHHYLGTWKVRGGWSRRRIDLYRLWRKVKSFMAPESR